MNFDQLAKNQGKQVRLRPKPHRRSPNGEYLPQLDDLWSIDQVLRSPNRIRLTNIHTHHTVLLYSDSLREFRHPDMLVLRAQLTLTNTEVLLEPVVPATELPGLPTDAWDDLLELMPGLLNEIRSDLAAHPSFRNAVLLKKGWSYWSRGSELAYYYEDHPDLDGHFHVLENHNLVTDITSGNVTRYRLAETLVKRLKA